MVYMQFQHPAADSKFVISKIEVFNICLQPQHCRNDWNFMLAHSINEAGPLQLLMQQYKDLNNYKAYLIN